ncbi:ABC transporter permease [Roseisolibacter agri]|uniref:ABC transporter permease n=1 Tax=Roseisolibacter agri TaxID=2014610 RepID=A0AA37Q4Z1_9BACT|nr:ABC transporter permease [Roseisolibacter agri]GLC26690.1 ABC transporter permease [Roseisolibacter agri]
MGDFEKLKAIVAREFMERVRTKWFFIITLLGPVLLSLLLFLPAWLASRDRTSRASGPIVVLDATGAGVGERVRQALSAPASGLPPVIGAAARATIPVEVRPTTLDSLAHAESLATRAVMDKEAQGYLVIGPRVFEGDSARYSGRNATSVGDMARLTTAVRTALLDVRLERAGVPPERIREVTRYRGGLKTERLTERGRGGSGEANLALALGVSFLLYISIVLYGQNVLRGVLEEKTTRVAEVVLSSVRSDTLLAGKVLGVGAVGLLQILVWIAGTMAVGAYLAPFLMRGAGGAAAAATPGTSAVMSGIDFSFGAAAALLVFFVLGYTFYSSLYAAAGAMVNSEQEAQQVLQPLILPLVATAMLIQPVLLNPTGNLSRWAAIFPLSAPIIMPLRMSLTPVPAWEVALSVALLILACLAAIWAAARIYRVGLLMYGKRPTMRELARWIGQAG